MVIEWADIIKVGLGAILGAGGWGAIFNNLLQTKRIVKEQKAQILKDLMATRFDSPLDQKAAEAINFIPILFVKNKKDKEVRNAYSMYHSALINGLGDINYQFHALIVAIARNIGIEVDPVDLMRTPIYCIDRRMQDDEIRQKWKEKNQQRERVE